MDKKLKCQIVSVGKRRDGGTRYWCTNHKADATAKYGRPDSKCRNSDIPPIGKNERIHIDVNEYLGGLAIWGAVPPIYDTTSLPLDRGIHVHARKENSQKKEIDSSFRSVTLSFNGQQFEILELDAIYFMVSHAFGFQTKLLKCPTCQYAHLDKDWFSVHPHKKHLCSGCGKNFSGSEKSIGNPLSELCRATNNLQHHSSQATEKLNINQSDYLGGIQVWGSNPAILWTNGRHEVSGIHVHAYLDDYSTRNIDETFGAVAIDDTYLDPFMVRTLMAQNCLPHLSGRIVSLKCENCNTPYFDTGPSAFTPVTNRLCELCGYTIKSNSRLRKVVSNPLVKIIDTLSHKSTSPRQQHQLDLVPETI